MVMFRSCRVFTVCLLIAVIPGMAAAQQQRDPVPVLHGVIQQFQSGTPQWNWYSPQLWELFRVQTQDTGIYWPLQQLGAAGNIVVNSSLELPVGSLYSMTAYHDGGRSDWRIGINKFTDRIEYADMAIGQDHPFPLPSAAPSTPAPPAIAQPGPAVPPAPEPKPAPDPKVSEACKLYPDLC